MAQREASPGWLTMVAEFEDRVDQQRASSIMVISFFLAVIGVIWLIILGVSYLINPGQGIIAPVTYIATYYVPIMGFFCWSMARQGRLGIATAGFVSQTILIPLTFVDFNALYLSNVILFTIPVAAAGGLLRRSGVAITTIIMMVIAVVFSVGQRQAGAPMTINPAETVLADLAVVLVTLAVDAALLYGFAGWPALVAADAQRDVLALQRVAAFGASLDIDNEERLMGQALSFVRTELKFSFAQIYLTGTGSALEERVRLIPGGKNRIERGPASGLPEASAVREAATVRRTLRVSRADSYLRRTHFLPTTVTGALLPLVYGENLLGVMDVQHEAVDFIPDYQLLTLQTLADNLAATLVTVRQSLALKTTVRQQEETALALRTRLQELTSGSRRTGQRAGQRIAGYDIDGRGQLVPSTDMSETLRAGLESSGLQVVSQGDQRVVRLPISLRDEQLGVMSFTLPNDKPLTERQLETARVVANRLALALENKRLVEQTRAQIERERIASDVSSRLISATDVDSVLSVAVENFREVLGAVNSRITVQPFTAPADRDKLPQAQPVPAAQAVEDKPS